MSINYFKHNSPVATVVPKVEISYRFMIYKEKIAVWYAFGDFLCYIKYKNSYPYIRKYMFMRVY